LKEKPREVEKPSDRFPSPPTALKEVEQQAPVSTALDAATMGRVNAIYKEEARKWEAAILAIWRDSSLSPAQRNAAIAALRIRQAYEAKGARKRALEEEKQKAKAFKRYEDTLRTPPKTR